MVKLPLPLACGVWRLSRYAALLGAETGRAGRTIVALILLAAADVLLLLPAKVQTGLICLTALWFMARLLRGLRRVPFPSLWEAEDALERYTPLPHQPLFSRRDAPAFPLSALEEERWKAFQTAQRLASKRAWRLCPPLRRIQIGLLSVAAFIIVLTGLHYKAIENNLTLQAPIPGLTDPLSAELWLEPPSYTGLPRQMLSVERAVSVPEGSMLYARISGASLRPRVFVNNNSFRTERDGAVYTVKTPITSSAAIHLRQGFQRRGTYRVQTIPDTAPQITLSGATPEDPSGVVLVEYSGRDDYGLVRLDAVMQRLDEPYAAPQRVTLLDWPMGSKQAAGQRPLDMTGTALAGKPVSLTLEAVDAAGHTSRSESLRLVLPKRRFTHPMAQKIALVRDSLQNGGVNFMAAARQLRGFGDFEADAFSQHWDALMAVRVAAAQLRSAELKGRAAGDVLPLLWHAAVTLDKNDVEQARSDLRAAAAALDDALKNPGDKAALKEALKRYQQAMSAYLQQLAAESGNAPPPGASSASNAMAGDLAAMLQQLAESGDTASAAALLQKMQALMERLRGGAPSPEQLAAQQAAQEIRALQQNQQQLLQQLRSGGAPLDTLQPAQQAISDGLRAVQQRLAEAGANTPPLLRQAENSAAFAAEGLGNNDYAQSEAGQTKTLELLSDALKNMQQQSGMMQLSGAGLADALGASSIPVPDNGAAGTLRALVEELRKRANDGSRTERERRYLRELLENY
ncbi:MAG: DUF4175 domain-containing protein [Alphaproteobacteria bacterium]|jgi:hypothetical protein|nr:DUF4175 domain-containing protein [Alphaproteobacteria bacterium]